MPAADYERAMVKLRAHVASKSSHGRDELLRRIAEIEQECLIPEDQEGYDDRPVRRPAERLRRHVSEYDKPADAVSA